MYAGVSNTENFLARTGSYSLRFRKTGDNSDLAGLVVDVSYTADKAVDVAIMVQDLTNEIIYRKEKIRPMQLKIEKINKKLTETLPFNLFEPLKKERGNLNNSIQELSRQIGALKKRRAELAPEGNVQGRTFGETFVAIAQLTLPPDVFKEIRQATIDTIKKAQNL